MLTLISALLIKFCCCCYWCLKIGRKTLSSVLYSFSNHLQFRGKVQNESSPNFMVIKIIFSKPSPPVVWWPSSFLGFIPSRKLTNEQRSREGNGEKTLWMVFFVQSQNLTFVRGKIPPATQVISTIVISFLSSSQIIEFESSTLVFVNCLYDEKTPNNWSQLTSEQAFYFQWWGVNIII